MRGLLPYIACLIGVFGHASSEFVAKIAQTPGPEFTVWRFMIGGACLILLTQIWPGQRDLITPLKKDGVRIVVLSCICMAMGQLIFHWALDFTSVVQVATVVTGIPIFVVIIDRIINGAAVTAPKMISGIGAFAAVILLMWNSTAVDISFGGDNLVGTVMAFICAIIGGLYLVLARPLVVEYGPVRMTAYTFGLGFFFLYVVVGVAWGTWVDPLSLFDRIPIRSPAF